MAVERIGVLLVHGIGNQRPNQHLVHEAHNIVAAMGDEVAAIAVITEPDVPPTIPDRYVADFDKNIVRVDVTTKGPNARELRIEFNEVYWADLGEAPTLPRQVSFWFWALSMWTVAGREYTTLEGFNSGMYIPKDGKLKFQSRIVLGFYGALFLLGAFTVGLANVILDRLKLPRFALSDILTAYVGDVMLYTQPSRDDDPAVGTLGQPPRAQIRARMVEAMVEFAIRDYSQWFIVAHSLGSVVAHNGLMELEDTLPNYLSEEQWARLRTVHRRLCKNVAPVDRIMLPRRPPWLAPTDGIDRRVLFARLRGLLTYGSPIGKFHAMWPVMVPNNNDEFVFHPEFCWFNLYDPTDPVSGLLKAYTRKAGCRRDGARIKNDRTPVDGLIDARIDHSIAYRANWVWLLSHLKYLDYPPRGFVRPPHILVFKLAAWLRGEGFDAAGLRGAEPAVLLRGMLRIGEVCLVAIAVWLSTAALLHMLIPAKWIGWLQDVEWPAAGIAALAAAAMGNIMAWLAGRHYKSAPPRWVRPPIIAAAAVGYHYVQPWVAGPTGWWHRKIIGWASGLFDRVGIHDSHLVDHVDMSLGLLSLTVVAIVMLGAIRWLFQRLPAK